MPLYYINTNEIPSEREKTISSHVKAWPNACNILTQLEHLAALLHDVASCLEGAGQTHATFSTFSTQHVDVHVPQSPGAQQVDLTRMP